MIRLLPVISACLFVATLREACADPIPGTKQPAKVDFQREVQPLLAERCYRCHGPDAAHRKADLRLDTLEGATQDLGDRRAIVAHNPRESELLTRVTTDDSTLRMPPPEGDEPLSPREVELLTRWIEQGAEYSRHWLHAPLVRPTVPLVKSDLGTGNAIDAFVVAKLEAEGIPLAAEADQRTLVRRLANPAFGERMAVYWLDLVRYADTVGYHGDQEHHISPYRDYVISAFNQNLPFDRFTREQLAGDLLPDPTLEQRVATGYIRVLQTSHEGGVQRAEYQKKYDADRVRNLGSVWLGMTVACAECHDHKYDPIRQRDFYSLAAFFADVDDVRSFSGGDSNPTRREPEIEILSDEDRSLIEQWKREIAELTAKGATDETKAKIKAKQSAINAARGRGRRSMIVERIEPREIRVLARGNWMDESGPIVAPAPPIALGAFPVGDRRATRLDLSNWLTTEARGQTARVFVNRLWSLFFGHGLSRTLDDFGIQGDRPSHPELLEWLASEFMDSGWDVKHMVRLIVSSRTYRVSSRESPVARERDPDNRWLSHQGRWRLPAEAVRDQALSVSGLLVTRLGGKSVRPWQPEGYYVQLNFPRREYQPDRNADQYRRG
ncbi:MAG: PSD1 and planctomycete cytochrome C domain-containing protein, partial [Planctomycetota bacterium]|nr:PSD1 and planctomycete cytochrome C domain-containing protein [Planctomycetota bacterium]